MRSEIQIRKAYKLILSRLKQKEYSKFYDRRSYRRRIFHNNHRELPDVKIGGLKHDNIVSYQTRLQIIKCFHLNDILFHVLGKLVHQVSTSSTVNHPAGIINEIQVYTIADIKSQKVIEVYRD